jgi:hypothetical protein
MAKIEFSQGFMSGLPARIARVTGSIPGDVNTEQSHGLFGSGGANGTYSAGSFRIYKGVKPAISFIKNTTNALNAFNNDLLLTFEEEKGDFSNTIIVSNPIVVRSTYISSIKSGTAAWFCMGRTRKGYDKHIVFNHAIIGDVGLIGSGADLELPDLNIVAGISYRIDNFKINLPSSWEY